MMNKPDLTSSEPQLDELETHLAGTLRRVAPRRDFVRRLRGHIHFPPREEIATRTPRLEKIVHDLCQCGFGHVDYYHYCPGVVSFVWTKKWISK